jgi:hypothetical protein
LHELASHNPSGDLLSPRKLRIIEEASAIEAEDAKAAGAIGYMARVLAQVSMPYSKQDGSEFTRTNGSISLSILSPSKVGLPYGAISKLILAWLTTQAVREKERHILIDHTLSAFMRELGIVPTGGRWGSIARLKEHVKRLFCASISCSYENENEAVFIETGMRIADESRLWWDPKSPDQAGLWRSEVVLSQKFFDEVTNRPVPVDMRALRLLKKSPLELDLYSWLTYRMSYLRRPTEIPWALLQMQFGSNFKRDRDFKVAVIKHLPNVLEVYKGANVECMQNGLRLKPGSTHIKKRQSILL